MASGFGSYSSGLNIAGVLDYSSKPASPVSPLARDEKLLSECDITITPEIGFKRIYLTIAAYLAFLGSGFSVGVVGPTLVHLEQLFNTDTSGISKAFIGINIGYIAGTFTCAIMFDKLNREMQLAFWGVVQAVTLIYTPWVPGLYYYYAIAVVQNLAQGMLFASGQSFIVKVWEGFENKIKGPIVIGCYMAWSCGSFTCPFVAMPFLNGLEISYNSSQTENQTLASSSDNVSVVTPNGNNLDNNSMFGGVYRVRYIYAIVGLVNILAAVLYFIAFIFNGPSLRPKDLPTVGGCNEKQEIKMPTTPCEKTDTDKRFNHAPQFFMVQCTMIFLLWLFAVSYVWTEYTLGCFIAVFTNKELGWSVELGAVITAVLYGFMGVGRIAGLGVAKLLSPGKVILFNTCLTTIAMILLMFSHHNRIIVWTAVALAGYAMSTTVPSSFLWMSHYMPVTGVMSGLYMSGIATGCMLSGYLVGYLFDNVSRMWVIFSPLVFSILTIGVFICLVLVGKWFKHLQKEKERISKGARNKMLN